MITSLQSRKVVELEQKLAGLREEFVLWNAAAEVNAPLEKHHTQILRITRQLDELAEGIGTTLTTLPADEPNGVLRDWRRIELKLLEVFRIWEFFRSKIALRYVPSLTRPLLAADEFAWACYEPARLRLPADRAEQVKEPPLVFLNGGSSPLTSARGFRYTAEEVSGEAITTEEFAEVLQDLPIPVIGMPWFQMRDVPDLVMIGHEVGHAVESDMELAGNVLALIDAALESADVPENRRTAWNAWAPEVFADVYGVLAAGPAFVDSLIDLLARDQATIATESMVAPAWGRYPTSSLRIRLATAALQTIGFCVAATNREQYWSGAFPTHAMEAFDDDIDAIVTHLIDGTYAGLGGCALRDVLCFTATDQDRAADDAELLLLGAAPNAKGARSLVASARLAFSENPANYRDKRCNDLVISRLVKHVETGMRAGDDDPDRLKSASIDQAAGRSVGSRIERLLDRGPDDQT